MESALTQPELLLKLPIEDILNLCSTNRAIRQLCQRDDFWKTLTNLKFGPSISSNCYKEIFIMKSIIKQYVPSKVITGLLENGSFGIADLMIKMGLEFDLYDVIRALNFEGVSKEVIEKTLQVLADNNIDYSKISQIISEEGIERDLISALISIDNLDWVNSDYFTIINELPPNKQAILKLVRRLLADPSFDINQVSQYGDHLLEYNFDEDYIELLLENGARLDLIDEGIRQDLTDQYPDLIRKYGYN